jgi:hypothetical protein
MGNGAQQPLQALQYNLNDSEGLSVSYENSTAVKQFVDQQNEKLFYLAFGVPLLISTLLEFSKLNPRIPTARSWHVIIGD